jgi:cytoskeleton protein RodZ
MNEQVPGQQPANAAAESPALPVVATADADSRLQPPVAAVASEAEVGARLRAIRELTGLSREEFARKARIPTAVLGDLESGQLFRLGAAVYVRGYVRSVARAASVDDSELMLRLQQLEAAQGPQQPATVAPRMSGGAPRWLTRYATPVAYALLTGVVVVPLVYLARPGGSELAQVPTLTPIDAPQRSSTLPAAVSKPAQGTRASTPGTAVAPSIATVDPVDPVEHDATQVGPPAVPAESPQPVMATFAPMPEAASGKPSQRVTLRLSAPSWVEFTGSDGSRLEYALLPAGTTRDYQLQGSAELRIGNSGGAQLTVDGKPVDLASISRANVAIVVLGKPGNSSTD